MDSSSKRPNFTDDDCDSMPEAERTVRAIIELVQPLVREGNKPTVLDIFQDLMLPMEGCRWSELLEIKRLCAIFSVILHQAGNAILTTLATYIATTDGEHTLKHFLDQMDHLVHLLGEAYDRSVIEAFHIGLTKELDDEPF